MLKKAAFAFAGVIGFSALCASSSSAQTQPQAHHIKGFSVMRLAPPTTDVFPLPSKVTGAVLYFVGTKHGGAGGADPFATVSKLAGISPYLSIQANASATFLLPAPAKTFTLLWGSPDPFNRIEFYDQNNGLIGYLSGADDTASFGNGADAMTSITSEVPFQKVVLISAGNYFEFSNVSAQ